MLETATTPLQCLKVKHYEVMEGKQHKHVIQATLPRKTIPINVNNEIVNEIFLCLNLRKCGLFTNMIHVLLLFSSRKRKLEGFLQINVICILRR